MKKLLLGTFLSSALILGGCGGDGRSNESGTEESATNGEPVENLATEADELSLWAPFSGDDGPFMEEIVNQFNDSQDQYTVRLQIEPDDTYYRTVDLAINDQASTPDLMVMHNEQIISYADIGLLREANEYIEDDLTEIYHEKGVEGATVDGVAYGVPLDIHSMLLFWNKDMFEAAGLDPDTPPTDREEFIEYAIQLTDSANNEYGFVVPTLWPQQFIVPTILAQNGGQMYSDGEVNFTSDEMIDAVQFQVDLIEEYEVSPSDVQSDGELTLFLQSRNAMHLNGPWMYAQWVNSDLNLGVAPVPQLGTEQDAVFAKSHNFVVLNSTEDEKIPAISEFLNFVSENGLEWAKSGQAPASQVVYESDEFKELHDQGEVMASQFDDAVFSPEVENWELAVEPLYEAINLILLGQEDIETALQHAENEANSILAE